MGSPTPEGTEMLPVFTGSSDYFENIEKRRLISDKRQLSNVICYEVTVFVPFSDVLTALSWLSC